MEKRRRKERVRPVRGKWGKERTENKQKEGADEQNRRTKGSRKRWQERDGEGRQEESKCQ